MNGFLRDNWLVNSMVKDRLGKHSSFYSPFVEIIWHFRCFTINLHIDRYLVWSFCFEKAIVVCRHLVCSFYLKNWTFVVCRHLVCSFDFEALKRNVFSRWAAWLEAPHLLDSNDGWTNELLNERDKQSCSSSSSNI
jgi:hypothetical protein